MVQREADTASFPGEDGLEGSLAVLSSVPALTELGMSQVIAMAVGDSPIPICSLTHPKGI